MELPPGSCPDRALSLGALRRLLEPPFRRERWIAAIHPHFHVRIGNITPCTEHISALDQIERLLGRIEGFDSHFCEVWIRRGAIVVETQVRFYDGTGELQTIPCVVIARGLGGKLADLRIVLDPTPLFRPFRIDGLVPILRN